MTSLDAPKRANGVLPMPAGQAGGELLATSKPSKSKTPVEGCKVVIRRLPPGLTQEEFWGYLGDNWKAGQGMVNWFDFKQGKMAQDPAKLSKPGRAYLYVLKREYLTELSDIVQDRSWEDARATTTSPCLVGPPVLEFCIYKRIPGNKKRNDQRQGTIDQDPEFMAYLISLTNPEPEKDTEDKTADEAEADVKVTTTPLVEYLKEKKANKAKEAAAVKSAKHARQESQGGKHKGSTTTTDEPKRSKKDKDSKTSKSSEKPKETVKILTKKAATAEAVKAAENAASQIAAAQDAPKSRRANIAAAARILQRDLGLSPGNAHRRARHNVTKSEAEAKTSKEAAAEATSSPAAPSAATAPAKTSTTTTASTSAAQAPDAPAMAPTKSGRSRRGGGGKGASEVKSKTEAKESTAPAPAKPVVLLKKKDKDNAPPPSPAAQTPAPKESSAPSKSSAPAATSKSSGKGSNSKKASSSTSVTPGATRGFVKHANPSQGVTEALLKQTLQTFGTVTFVEIDRRKGFAYVDFSDHESLVKAITSSPVTVAQAAVQVLERKDKKPVTAAAGNSKESSTPTPAAPATEKPEQQGSSGPRRNRRGRGGGGGGKGGGNAGEGGKGAAAASKTNIANAGTG